jgi:hypothetical protein
MWVGKFYVMEISMEIDWELFSGLCNSDKLAVETFEV